MEAIQLVDHVPRPHRYASGGLVVTPNPPQVGVATTIALYLKNTAEKPITVTRIETMVAQFGMGVHWEQLPAVGPFHLPADSNHVEQVKVEWTPLKGGHRCVRAYIHTDTFPGPIMVGCNLHVIEAEAEQTRWRVPFRLGNPEDRRVPVALDIGGSGSPGVAIHAVVNGRLVRPGEPIWLNAREEVDAELLVQARTAAEIDRVTTVEATIEGRFIDGIQVVVHRPANTVRSAYPFTPVSRSKTQEVMMDEMAVLIMR